MSRYYYVFVAVCASEAVVWKRDNIFRAQRRTQPPGNINTYIAPVKLSHENDDRVQEHNVVLVRPGRLKDCPGVKTRCVRGKYDLPHVIKKEAGAKK